MTSTDTGLDVAEFVRRFPGHSIVATDARYDAARALWNGTADGHPAVIARCGSTAEVVAAVGLARDAGATIAVRGGGHSLPGLSTCEGGVVIDLSGWRDVRIDPDRRRASVAPGATWGVFDAAAARHGMATTGGLISTTGVAGLTLGGGIGWLQRRYGLACDNLRAAEIVTASGDVVQADDRLMWALRGGGGNFGVVTRFDFELHPVPGALGGLLAFPLERGREILMAFREWAADAPDEASLLASIMTAPPEEFVPAELVGQKVIALIGCWCGDPAAGATSLAPLRSLRPVLDRFGEMPYPALQSMLDRAAPKGVRNYYRGGFLAEITDDVIDVAVDRGWALRSPMSMIHFHQMGGAVGRVGADSSAFSGRDAGYVFNLISTWTDPAQDGEHIGANRDLGAALAPHSLAGSYVNFVTEADPNRVRPVYGDEIYRRLARIKREYDPTNLFHRNQNIRPAP